MTDTINVDGIKNNKAPIESALGSMEAWAKELEVLPLRENAVKDALAKIEKAEAPYTYGWSNTPVANSQMDFLVGAIHDATLPDSLRSQVIIVYNRVVQGAQGIYGYHLKDYPYPTVKNPYVKVKVDSGTTKTEHTTDVIGSIVGDLFQ